MQKKKVELRFGCDIGRNGKLVVEVTMITLACSSFTLMHKANGRFKRGFTILTYECIGG